MSTYKKYNHKNTFPLRPASKFPKRNITSVADWAKSEIISLEGINLDKELQNEYLRVEKMKSSTNDKKNDINLLTNQF